jgi:hypothetical protein
MARKPSARTPRKGVIARAVSGPVKVELEWIGEGYHGDYNPADPQDEPLLRFYTYLRRGRRWEAPEGPMTSFCTLTPATVRPQTARALARMMARTLRRVVESDRSLEIACEGLSHAHPSWLRRRTPSTSRSAASSARIRSRNRRS